MTIEERLGAVEQELASSRRRNRRLWESFAIIVGLFVLTWSLSATTNCNKIQSTSNEIRANKFIVEDENGEVRVLLGKTGLEIYDENGKLCARLIQDKRGSLLGFYDENGEPRVNLGSAKEGPRLALADENGEVRAELSAFKDGPGLWLADEKEIRTWLTLYQDEPSLLIYDENGETRAWLGIAKDGPSLGLSDENGVTIWNAP